MRYDVIDKCFLVRGLGELSVFAWTKFYQEFVAQKLKQRERRKALLNENYTKKLT